MSEEKGQGGGLLDGFEGYLTATDSDYDYVLQRGLVVTDSNVLLNLYRYSSQARGDLLEVLDRVGERLWIPHQVVVEFWRNRETAAVDFESAVKSVTADLRSGEEEAAKVIRTWANRVSLHSELLAKLEGNLSEGFANVVREIESFVKGEARSPVNNTHQDEILSKLIAIFEGKVGAEMEQADYSAMVELSKSRVERKVPPGYRDAGKGGDRSAGDFLLWEQSIREVERRQCPLLIVTGDVKEDWWRIEHGKTVGPRIEMAQELYARTKQRLFMMRPDSLLVHASRALRVSLNRSSVTDIEQAEEFIRVQEFLRAQEVADSWVNARRSHTISRRIGEYRELSLLDRFRQYLEKQKFLTSVGAEFWDLRADRVDGVKLAVTVLSLDGKGAGDEAQLGHELDRINEKLSLDGKSGLTPLLLSTSRPSFYLRRLLDHSNIGIVWLDGHSWRGNVTVQNYGLVGPDEDMDPKPEFVYRD